MEITNHLRKMLKTSPHQRERLAASLSVSASTIDRWASGSVQPTSRHLADLREVLADLHSSVAEDRLLQTLSQCLRAAREIMHKYGAASSRNDALDQISLVLTLHLQLLREGRLGLQTLSESSLHDTFLDQVVKLRDHMPGSAAEKFSQAASSMAERRGYLHDIVESLRAALEEIDASENWRRPHEFHELFVNFLATSFHEEKEFAQYMTPREVVDFMVRIGSSLCEARDPIVLDPSCGTGSFLTSFAEVFAEKREIERDGEGDGWLSGSAADCLVGVDTSERMVRLAAASFVASGVEPRNLFLDSSIDPQRDDTRGILANGVFDLILTNPPFGAEHSRGNHGGGRVPSEVIYLERYVEWLRPGGIALSIVPDSVLTNKGPFSQLRMKLLDQVDIIAVISLPPVTFAASGTTTKTSIIAFRKKDRRATSTCLFAVATHVGFQVSTRGSVRRRTPSTRNDLPGIADAILFTELDYEFSVRREVNETLDRWDAQFLTSSLALETASSLAGSQSLVGSVAELITERADPTTEPGDLFPYIEISNVDGELLRVSATPTNCADAPSRARRRVRAGDVIVSTVRPERRTLGVVPPHLDGAICSTGFAILRAKSISPYVLAAALRSSATTAQLVGVSSGVAYPAFEAKALSTVTVDLGDEAWQAGCVEYGAALETLEILRRAMDYS